MPTKGGSYIKRPGVSDGWWLCALLPACYGGTIWRSYQHHQHHPHLPQDYKRSVIVTCGLLLHSLAIYGQLGGRLNGRHKVLLQLTFSALLALLFHTCLAENVVFCVVSAVLPIVLYDRLYFTILRAVPKGFTYGEAFVVCQGLVSFAYSALLQLPRVLLHSDIGDQLTDMSTIYLILQIGLVGIGLLLFLTYSLRVLRYSIPFWISLALTTLGVALCPIGKQPAITRLVLFLVGDVETMVTTVVYLGLLVVTVSFVMWHFNKGRQSTTATRKVFHVLIVLVYAPGLWYQCKMLYLASGLMLAVFIVLEMARLIQLEPVAPILNTAVRLFIDEKDAGAVALTPLYLLIGCTLPLWLYPSPCDLTNSAGLQMLLLSAGILSIGIGDTAASVVGYYFGRHKWNASTNKSVEGTLASVILQSLAVYGMYHLGLIHLSVSRAAYAGIAIIVNALVESRTDQIDNLVLPLVTYAILVCST
ncbi:dolichol kinase [Anopheles aquasalis]|uniref:dolichol kinase n=1 Tax=Anopheles aquasalis TaxID=42839 RepID=UPI00215A750B|nr:dolichol kinase [Anopheles aquasalis]